MVIDMTYFSRIPGYPRVDQVGYSVLILADPFQPYCPWATRDDKLTSATNNKVNPYLSTHLSSSSNLLGGQSTTGKR